MREADILAALHEAYIRAGTQTALAKTAGVSQGRIADYLNERCSVGNMTVSVFLRLFPDMTIDFWGAAGVSGDDPMREELLHIFDALSPRDRARCLALLAAHFGDKLREEPQPVKKVAGCKIS